MDSENKISDRSSLFVFFLFVVVAEGGLTGGASALQHFLHAVLLLQAPEGHFWQLKEPKKAFK